MATVRGVQAMLAAAAAAGAMALPAQAQQAGGGDPTAPALRAGSLDGLGLNPARAQVPVGCGASLLPCRDDAARLAAGRPDQLRWTVEMGTLSLAAAARDLQGMPRQGLNFSLVGRQPLFGSAFSVYGKLGSTFAGGDGARMALGDSGSGYGTSFGAGLRLDVSNRLSATFGFDSYELRHGSTSLGGNGPVRATSLGLRYSW